MNTVQIGGCQKMNKMNDILKPGSIWVGKKPKDGDILTACSNIPPYKPDHEFKFRYDEKLDKLIPINNGKESNH